MLFIVCGEIESNPGPASERRVQILYSIIRGLHANLDELTVSRSEYAVMVCAESKIFDRRHLSELRIPGFGCPTEAEELHTWYPGNSSLRYGRIPLLPTEQVGVSLPGVLCFVFSAG